MTDDALRDQLSAVDPARSLPPADPDRVARLLEDTMTDQLTHESRADGTHDRSRLTWLVAAAAVVLIGGGVLVAVLQGEDDPAPPTASDPGTSEVSPGARTVTRLRVDDQPTTRCVSPQDAPEVVAAQTLAVDATVTSISGGVVTLEPTRFYAGGETDLVTVRAVDRDLQSLLAGVRFEEGGRYLVSATGGRVTLCGFSAEYSEALAGVYAEAFPR